MKHFRKPPTGGLGWYLVERGAGQRLCVRSTHLREPGVFADTGDSLLSPPLLLLNSTASEAKHTVEPGTQRQWELTEWTFKPEQTRWPNANKLTEALGCIAVPVFSMLLLLLDVDTPPRPAHGCRQKKYFDFQIWLDKFQLFCKISTASPPRVWRRGAPMVTSSNSTFRDSRYP